MALNITLNGQAMEFPNLSSTASVADLVAELALKGDRIAIEWNGDLAQRSRWPEIVLASGDRLEVVHFVGGGTSPHR